MEIALFGVTGMLGQRIAREAIERGHKVRAIVRHLPFTNDNMAVVVGDVLDKRSVAEAVSGSDVVASAVGPGQKGKMDMLTKAAHALLEGVAEAGVKRLLVVGGAGSLEVAPGKRLMDTPEFPQGWRGIAQAHSDALQVYRDAATTLDWVYISPAAFIAPGQRTGKYRIGTERLVVDEKGESRISAEDFAVAIVDEIEKPHFIRQRFTAAY